MKNVPTDELIRVFPEAEEMILEIHGLLEQMGEKLEKYKINNTPIIRYVFFDVSSKNVHIGYETQEKLN